MLEIVHPVLCSPRSPCSKTTSSGRDLHESFIFIQQRTHDVELGWASESWPTLADHRESHRPLGEFLPKTHIEVCVVEVREAHDGLGRLVRLPAATYPF